MEKTKLPNKIVLIILTSVTILLWVAVSVYTAISKKTPAVVSKEILLPLNPKLDIETLNQMEERIYP